MFRTNRGPNNIQETGDHDERPGVVPSLIQRIPFASIYAPEIESQGDGGNCEFRPVLPLERRQKACDEAVSKHEGVSSEWDQSVVLQSTLLDFE